MSHFVNTLQLLSYQPQKMLISLNMSILKCYKVLLKLSDVTCDIQLLRRSRLHPSLHHPIRRQLLPQLLRGKYPT